MPVRQTGWKPVPPKAAGTEARPTNLFMLYGWTKGPGATAWQSSRRGGALTAPTKAFQALRVSQRPMGNCFVRASLPHPNDF